MKPALVKFKEISHSQIKWDRVNLSSVSVFQLPPWIDYYIKSKIPFRVVSISLEDREIGHITLCTRKFMLINHLGSPLPGTATGFGGIVFYEEPDFERRTSDISIYEVYDRLIQYLAPLSSYVIISDLNLESNINGHNWTSQARISVKNHYFLDLNRNWDEIFRSFKDKSCRYEYRKGLKNGLSVSFTDNIADFITYHYEQILNVYRRKGLVPTFSRKRILNIVEALYPGNILLGTCFNEKNEPVASCIIIYNEYCSFLTTSACLDSWLGKGANELLMVECIREVKARGASRLEFGGGMTYKEKYGPVTQDVPVIEYSTSYNIDYQTIGKIYKKVRKFPVVQLILQRFKR